MLQQITVVITISSMAVTLWMAFYLLARGFPSPVTLRGVLILLALATFFFSAYQNIFEPNGGTAGWRAALLVLVLALWYSVTFDFMPESSRQRLRRLSRGIYILAVMAFSLLLTPGAFINETGNALYVAHMAPGMANLVYSVFQLAVCAGILTNLLIDNRVGLSAEGRYLLAAAIFPIGSVIYGVVSLTSTSPMPRVVMDLLIFCGIFLVGLSVARYQTLVERRTTLHDFPLTAVTALSITGLYVLLARSQGILVSQLAGGVGLTMLGISAYDLIREFLERQRLRQASEFRKQLRQLEYGLTNEERLSQYLQDGLELLSQTLNAVGGFVALRQQEHFVVTATQRSLPGGSRLDPALLACEDICRAAPDLHGIAWVAPVVDGDDLVAVIALGPARDRVDYAAGDLDLLDEAATQAGRIISLSNLQYPKEGLIQQLVQETQNGMMALNQAAHEMRTAMTSNPDPEFVKLVEDALRHLADTITLGDSPLAALAGDVGDTHVARGQQLRDLLLTCIETLRPMEKRPGEPLPRSWYNYVVLYDAYVEGVQNREIMARLYISEGTFNRTRRNALRGLARLLLEKQTAR